MQLRQTLSVAVPYACIAIACFAGLRYLQPVRVTGESMRPALRSGDLVLVGRGQRVDVGEIALLRTERHGPVLHRVVGVEPGGALRTKGDANRTPDASATPESLVSGPVVGVIPIGRLIERWRHM